MELLLIYNIQFIYAANLIPTVNELKGLLSKYKPLTKKQKQEAITKEAKVKLITCIAVDRDRKLCAEFFTTQQSRSPHF